MIDIWLIPVLALCGQISVGFSSPSCSPIDCPKSSVFNSSTCQCDCQLSVESCVETGPLVYIDQDICQCRFNVCEHEAPCPKGEVLDWVLCMCVTDQNSCEPTKPSYSPCPSTQCTGNYTLNLDICHCECLLTTDDCPPPLLYLDPLSCQCRRCNRPRCCPSGQTFYADVCKCLPPPFWMTNNQSLEPILSSSLP